MKNETFDKLKWIAIFFVPATATLISTIGGKVGWEFTDTAVLIINALGIYIGSLLGVSNRTYNKMNEINDSPQK
ncbi:phage holin [Enterococcus avium]|uniref:phage holin n=1 Tax=Enterococcus avium TaxID=33945 RepID=UPI00288D17CF|nr:phage holin [Enterococcus avium]MDT2485064.1 phage holin [Enterococcus avium]MDT2511650.1 phage holin [Enterococcus avium]